MKETIVRDYGEETPCRKRRGDEAVFAPVAVFPAATVDEHDDGRRGLAGGRVDVQFVAVTMGVADVAGFGDANFRCQRVEDRDGGTGREKSQHEQTQKPPRLSGLIVRSGVALGPEVPAVAYLPKR